MNIPDDLNLCERGNTLLTGDDDQFVAWLTLEGNKRLEVAYTPGNYPALNVRATEIVDEVLAAHIHAHCVGWLARKCNVKGVKLDDHGRIQDTEDDLLMS